MTKVYFVRHAQTDYRNPIDKERLLTKQGMQDRYKARDYLLSTGIIKETLHLYSSTFQRAIDTVQPIADVFGLPIQLCEEFREWSILASEEAYFDACRHVWKDFTFRLIGCETLEEVQQRNVNKLLELVKLHQEETVVIGSHGTALSTVIHYFDPDFQYEDFMRIIDCKPWIVYFEFNCDTFVTYKEVFHNYIS